VAAEPCESLAFFLFPLEKNMKHPAHPLALAVLLSLSVQAQAACLDTRPSVFAGAVDSTVPNLEVDGVCMNDLIVDAAAEGANWGNHGAFVSAVSRLTQDWLKAKAIDSMERSRIVSAAARSDVGATLLVKIAAINDFHGQLFSPGNFAGKPVGGIDALAAYVNAIRAKSPNSVAVSAGDLIGATPLVSALFHDEPTIEGMNILGLDFNAVGNHEFDEGRDELLRMQNGGCHPTDPTPARAMRWARRCRSRAPGSNFWRPTSPRRPTARPCSRRMRSGISRATRWPSSA
jgi:5'-nucleotidase